MWLERIGELEKALLSADRVAAEAVLLASRSDLDATMALDALIVPTLRRIGEGWESGSVALAQVYMSSRICEELVDRLVPARPMPVGERPAVALVVLEDHHVLGKRIVYATLRASGVAVLDMGHGISVDETALRVAAACPDVLLVSTLMLPAALRVKDLMQRLGELPVRPRVAVGGAPFVFDDQLWREVGADAMGRTASDAVGLVQQLRAGCA